MKRSFKRIFAGGLAAVTAISATAISAYADETKTAETTAPETKAIDYSGAKTVAYDLTAPYNACVSTIKASTTKNKLAVTSTATGIRASVPGVDLPNLIDFYNVSEAQKAKIGVLYDLQSFKVTIKGPNSEAVYCLSADVASDYYDKDFAELYSGLSLYGIESLIRQGLKANFADFDGSFDLLKDAADNVVAGEANTPTQKPFTDLKAKYISDIDVEYVVVTRTLTEIPDITLKNYMEALKGSLGALTFDFSGGEVVGLTDLKKDNETGKTPAYATASVKGIVSYNDKTGKYTYTDDAIGAALKALIETKTAGGYDAEMETIVGTTIYKAYKESGLTTQEFAAKIATAIKAAQDAGKASSTTSEADARTKAADALVAAFEAAFDNSVLSMSADAVADSWFSIKTTEAGGSEASTTYKYGATAAEINAIFTYLNTVAGTFDPTTIDVDDAGTKLSTLKHVGAATPGAGEIDTAGVCEFVKDWAKAKVAGTASADLFDEILADDTIDWTQIVTVTDAGAATYLVTGIGAIDETPAAEYTVIVDGTTQRPALGVAAPIIDNVKTTTSAVAATKTYTATCNAKQAQFFEAMGANDVVAVPIENTKLNYYTDSTVAYINSTDTLKSKLDTLEKAIKSLKDSIKMTDAAALAELFEEKAPFGTGTVLDLLVNASNPYTIKSSCSAKRGTVNIPMEVNAQEWYTFTNDYDWRNSCYYLAEIVDTIDDAQGAIVSFHVDPNSLKKNDGIVATVGNYDAAKYFEEAAGAVVLRVNGQSTSNFTKLVTYDAKTSTLSLSWDDITGARYTNNVLYVRSLDLLSSMSFDMDKVQITVPTQEQFKPVEDIEDIEDTDDDDAILEDGEDGEDDATIEDGTEIEAGEDEKNDNVPIDDDEDGDYPTDSDMITPGAGDVNAATDPSKGSPDTGATPVAVAIPALIAGVGTFIKKRMSK